MHQYGNCNQMSHDEDQPLEVVFLCLESQEELCALWATELHSNSSD